MVEKNRGQIQISMWCIMCAENILSIFFRLHLGTGIIGLKFNRMTFKLHVFSLPLTIPLMIHMMNCEKEQRQLVRTSCSKKCQSITKYVKRKKKWQMKMFTNRAPINKYIHSKSIYFHMNGYIFYNKRKKILVKFQYKQTDI